MAKKPKPPGKKYNYMDTYGDLVTLLMCFFVLLFAMSTIEETKYVAFAEALSARFGTPADSPVAGGSDPTVSGVGEIPPEGSTMDPEQTMPEDLTQLEEAINKYAAENNMESEISVEVGESGTVFIRLSNNLLFDGDSSDLREESIGFLSFLADCFNSIESEILMTQYNGHTASIDGSTTDDWLLAAARAGEVSSFIQKDGGFNRFKVKSSFFGRNYPIADNGTPEGRAKNRRVDIIVSGNQTDTIEQTLIDMSRVYFPGDNQDNFEGAADDLPDNFLDSAEPNAELADMMSDLTADQREQLLLTEEDMAAENAQEADGAASG